jgi:hypothetical protein
MLNDFLVLHGFFLSIYGSTALVDFGRLFSFLIYSQSVGFLGWGISPHRKVVTSTQNKFTQTSMLRVGFEPTIPMFEREETVHALDRVTSVIGRGSFGAILTAGIITVA